LRERPVLKPATRGLFWDGPRSFGLQSDADTRAGTSLSKLPIHISGSLTHVRFN
ncbi:hypothetical protein AVEN_133953-1, partial [Araneus ventricosus]